MEQYQQPKGVAEISNDDDDIQDYIDTAKERMFAATFQQVVRNQTLEEVAREFDKMKVLGDTAASFAVFVRNMKK